MIILRQTSPLCSSRSVHERSADLIVISLIRALHSLLFSSIVLLATNAQAAESPKTAADAAWADLKLLGRPRAPAVIKGSPRKETRADKATRFISEANKLRDFYTAYPSHTAANEARALEAIALSHAALNGETQSDIRRNEIIETIRRDRSIAASTRFEVVAWSKQITVARSRPFDHATFLRRQQVIASELIAEFPEISTGYESLLGLALSGSSDEAKRITEQLIRLSTTPAAVRFEAERLLGRLGLLGQNVRTRFPGTALAQNSRPGRVLVIYSWTREQRASIDSAKRLLSQVAGVDSLGICLDNIGPGSEPAEAKELPGSQVFDPRGRAGSAATSMSCGAAPVIIIVDDKGIIRDVQGPNGFTSKLGNIRGGSL